MASAIRKQDGLGERPTIVRSRRLTGVPADDRMKESKRVLVPGGLATAAPSLTLAVRGARFAESPEVTLGETQGTG